MTRLGTKKDVNAMVAAITEAFKDDERFNLNKTSETVKITFGDEVIFRALKTNGPWLCTYSEQLFA